MLHLRIRCRCDEIACCGATPGVGGHVSVACALRANVASGSIVRVGRLRFAALHDQRIVDTLACALCTDVESASTTHALR